MPLPRGKRSIGQNQSQWTYTIFTGVSCGVSSISGPDLALSSQRVRARPHCTISQRLSTWVFKRSRGPFCSYASNFTHLTLSGD
ncbi:putative carboxylesterase 15 [Fusarium oxysporum f. sp. albedinis]|nr:putative carboxylesterase 15 [Fusarium oxysporum f. sp. albedinis]